MLLERVYRRVVYEFAERGKTHFTQKSLSQETRLSIGTVNYAVKPLFRIGAVVHHGRGFAVSNLRKLLAFWAVKSASMTGVQYRTFTDGRVHDVEMHIPSGCMFTAYSAYWVRFSEAPADYAQVHVYGNAGALRLLYPPSERGSVEIVVLRADDELKEYGHVAPLGQVYVDIWNLPEWMSSEFLKRIEARLRVE